jgi:hypothetical protein
LQSQNISSSPVFLEFEQFNNRDESYLESVWGLIQDSRGYIWITSDKLIRYDGYNFTPIDLDGAEAIKGTIKGFLSEDSKGNIWACHPQIYGSPFLYKYNLNQDRVSKFELPSNVNYFVEDDFGSIWCSTEKGLVRLEFPFPDHKDSIQITSFYPQFQPDLYQLVDSMKFDTVASLTKVGNNQNLSRTFEIERSSGFLILSTGEYLVDFSDQGWLENAAGDTLWIMSSSKAFHGGGSGKNKL